MSTTLTWTRIPSITPADTSTGVATGSPQLPGPLTAHTQADFLALLDRLFPPDFLDGLKSPGPGYELLQGYAKIFARISQAMATMGFGLFISSSHDGALATGTVELFRGSPIADSVTTVTVKAGTVLTTSASGRDFTTTQDVAFAPTDLGPFSVPVAAVASGYEWNVPGLVLTPAGDTLPGEIDTVKTLVEDPELGDISIQVQQTLSTSGGVDPELDQHGVDRGISRNPGEPNDKYRGRIRTLPDTVSPDALNRALLQLLDPVGITFNVIETWQVSYQTCWDAPGQSDPTVLDPNLFTYDDPRPTTTAFENRWLDENDHRGAFIVVISSSSPLNDMGMVWDDTGEDALNYVSVGTGGLRALCAYDVPSTLTGGYVSGFWDGSDTTLDAVLAALFDTLQTVKAGGVSAALELQGS